MSPENLQAEFKSRGWKISFEIYRRDGNILDWHAYTRFDDWPDCECNDKPPPLMCRPFLMMLGGKPYASVEFSVCGEAGGSWHDLKVYSVPMDHAIERLDAVTKSLGAAWRAVSVQDEILGNGEVKP